MSKAGEMHGVKVDKAIPAYSQDLEIRQTRPFIVPDGREAVVVYNWDGHGSALSRKRALFTLTEV